MKKLLSVALTVVCIGVLSHCTPHKQYRTQFDSAPIGGLELLDSEVEGRDKRVHEVYGDGVSISHIEFDDQGEFWRTKDSGGDSKNQLVSFEELIEARLRRGEFRKRGALIVTFVHGWNHSARERDTNLRDFRSALLELRRRKGLHSRPIVGVYLGWRGQVLPGPPKYLTYWDRKRKAQKVGHRRLGETLTRLAAVRQRIIDDPRGENRRTSERDAGTRLIVIGHSFGAAAVFTGVSRFFEDELTRLSQMQDRGGRRRKGEKGYIDRRWDLVVLVNPAFEALQYKAIDRYARKIANHQIANHHVSLSRFYRMPRLLVVSAENDFANKRLFPLGAGPRKSLF